MHYGSEHMIFHQINQLASTTRSNQHYQQPAGTNLRFWYKDWIQEMNQGEEMVLVKMLMEFDPLPVRGSMVMTMVTISPSRRDVSLVEKLHRSPRLVPPRFHLVAVVLHPESMLMTFSRTKDFIKQKMGIGGLPGGPRGTGRAQGGRARPPPSWTVAGSPLVLSSPNIFIYSETCSREVS